MEANWLTISEEDGGITPQNLINLCSRLNIGCVSSVMVDEMIRHGALMQYVRS